MSFDPLALRPLSHRESDRLADRLDRLSESDWERPTPCTEWAIADIVAHLSSGAGVAIRSFQRGFAGQTDQPFKDQAERAALTKAKRDVPASDKAADYRREMNRLLDFMDSLGVDDLDKTAWHASGTQQMRWFMGQRLGEITLHSTDIHQALGDNFTVPADVAGPITPTYLGRLPRMLKAEGARGVSALMSFGQCGALRIADGLAVYLAELPSGEKTTLEISAEPGAVLLMATGRLHPKDGLATGELRASGDASLLERWRELFRTL